MNSEYSKLFNMKDWSKDVLLGKEDIEILCMYNESL